MNLEAMEKSFSLCYPLGPILARPRNWGQKAPHAGGNWPAPGIGGILEAVGKRMVEPKFQTISKSYYHGCLRNIPEVFAGVATPRSLALRHWKTEWQNLVVF